MYQERLCVRKLANNRLHYYEKDARHSVSNWNLRGFDIENFQDSLNSMRFFY